MTKVVSEQAFRAAMKTANTVDRAKIVKWQRSISARVKSWWSWPGSSGKLARREEKLAS
jgi:hypothetical protein